MANRAVLKWLSLLGVAVQMLNRAETPEQRRAADEFAVGVMLDEPGS